MGLEGPYVSQIHDRIKSYQRSDLKIHEFGNADSNAMFYVNSLASRPQDRDSDRPVSSFSNMSKSIPNCLINLHIMATATFGLSVSVGISHSLMSICRLLDAMAVDVVKLQVPTQVQADTRASQDTDSMGRRVQEFQGCQGHSSIWVCF